MLFKFGYGIEGIGLATIATNFTGWLCLSSYSRFLVPELREAFLARSDNEMSGVPSIDQYKQVDCIFDEYDLLSPDVECKARVDYQITSQYGIS